MIGGNRSDDECKNSGLNKRIYYIVGAEFIGDPVAVFIIRYNTRKNPEYVSAEDAEEHRKYDEDRVEENSTDDLGLDKEAGGIDPHDLECINLFRNTHGAYFGGNTGSDLPGKDKADDRGGKLQDH